MLVKVTGMKKNNKNLTEQRMVSTLLYAEIADDEVGMDTCPNVEAMRTALATLEQSGYLVE